MNSTWIQQNSPTTGGIGSGSVAFTVAANTNPTPRTGTLTISLLGSSTVNYQVQIEQAGTIIAQPFNDVPTFHPYVLYVDQIQRAGLTNGCSLFPPLFCPDQTVTRGQMAVFVVRAAIGDNFSYPNLPYFQDVNQNHPFFKYVQKLRELGITTGCSISPIIVLSRLRRHSAANGNISDAWQVRYGCSGQQPAQLHDAVFYRRPCGNPGIPVRSEAEGLRNHLGMLRHAILPCRSDQPGPSCSLPDANISDAIPGVLVSPALGGVRTWIGVLQNSRILEHPLRLLSLSPDRDRMVVNRAGR